MYAIGTKTMKGRYYHIYPKGDANDMLNNPATKQQRFGCKRLFA